MKPYSVKECGKMISASFKKDYVYRHITVRGLVMGLHTHFSGISFFSLVEAGSRISCFIGRAHNTFLTRNLLSGADATVVGDLRYDDYQGRPVLYVERIFGISESVEKKEQDALVKELTAKGWLDPAGKKPLPPYPFHIAIITSGSGAVIHDIMRTGALRNDAVRYSLYNSSVQGEEAAGDLARAIREANEAKDRADILVLARGGGAEEDLSVFNDRTLVEAVHDSAIPIISAVGHETDTTLTDLAADARASTPTQAAEIAIPEKAAVAADIGRILLDMKNFLARDMEEKRYMARESAKRLISLSPRTETGAFRSGILSLASLMRRKLDQSVLTGYRETGGYMVKLMEGAGHGK